MVTTVMCKTPCTECQPVEDIPMEENNIVSDEESEPMDSDSYYTETSSDDGGSDSDAESASGNRVTKDMVVLLMLKENSVISEEFYAQKAETITDDIKSLIPKLPKSEPSSDAESSDLQNGSSLDLLEELLAGIEKRRSAEKASNEGNAESSNEKDESLKGNKSVKSDVTEKAASGVNKDDTNKPLEEERKEQSKGDMLVLQKEAVADFNKKECDVEVSTTQHQLASTETKRDITNHGDKPQTVNRGSTSDTAIGTINEESNIGKGKYTTSQCINKLSVITNTNAQNDVDQDKSKQDIVMEEPKPKNQYNLDSNKMTKSFKYILKRLVQEKRISEDYEYVDVLETYVKDLDKHYKSNKAVEKFDEPTEELREFAFFLNYYSPSSYKYIIEHFNTPLPEHKVLCSWYMKADHRPGLSKRAFDILKKKASKKRLTCALMSRDIFLTNYGFNYDQVDYGGGCNYEYTDKAVMAYVFVLVSLDEDWKMPIGYVFAKNVPPESQAELIRVCLTQCDDAGVDVVAVTVDTLTPATFLGCSFEDPRNLKTTFKHPVTDHDVAIWIDPCLALRSARHTLKVKEVLKDGSDAKICWNLIRKLNRLHSNETINFDKPEFLKLRNHIAKVGLTTEIFSNSLVPALQLCEELLPNMFKDTAATRKYIELVNKLYDILNSPTTDVDVIQDLNMAKDYMLGLFCNEVNKLSPFDKENLAPDKKLLFRSFVEGKPACGFIGFLICIESFKHLHATLVEKDQKFSSVNPHRLCKDHAEDFVKDLRAHSSLEPDEYTGFSFQCYYDQVFDVLEEAPRLSDQNVPLGHWRLKNRYPPALTIKLTSGKRVFDEVYSFQYGPKKLARTSHEDIATKLVRGYSKALDNEMDLSIRKNMVGYLAGWIAARFARHIKCETCIDALCCDKKLWFHKFITFKHVKGVCLPSEEIFRICWECERALRQNSSPAKLRSLVLRGLAQRFPWSRLSSRHHPLHHIQLARAVIAKYIPLRIAAPFSAKESQRILEIYGLFTCMKGTGLFDGIGPDEDEAALHV